MDVVGRRRAPAVPAWAASRSALSTVRALPRNGRAAQDPQEALDEVKPRTSGREGLVIAGKAALLAVAALAGTAATGLFLYVMISIVYGLWKRFGSCLIGLIVPLMLLGAPFVFIIGAHRQGASPRGWPWRSCSRCCSTWWNVRNLLRALCVARRATS